MLRRTILCAAAVAAVVTSSLRGADWPTYRHDNHRSARTAERLRTATLGEAWVYRSDQPPQPAWAGPAKWDAYAGIRGLRSMRNYDPAFPVIVAADAVYFGSSADDSLHCLDALTGAERWTFITDGPLRIAPAFAVGNVYFGSDDGHAYCVRASDGELVWKYTPLSGRPRLILNNGRFIPAWPCRTGVLVAGDVAYFGMGMLPWKETYLCAVDARDGSPRGAARFVKKLQDVTLEGALLASTSRLIAPQGRVPPLLFSRPSGEMLGRLDSKSGGGCFVVLTGDAGVLHGPGNKTGWISESNAGTLEKIASFANGNAVVVAGKRAFLLTDSSLAAIDRTSRETVWSKSCAYPYSLVLAGGTLVAGGTDEVAAFRARDGELLWKHAVDGKAFDLAVANGALFVSTDEGAIHCFRAGVSRVARAGETPAPVGPGAQHAAASPGEAKEKPASVDLALGPYLRFLGPETAEVSWRTNEPSPTILEYAAGGETRRLAEDAPTREHKALIGGLRLRRRLSYTIKVVRDGVEQSAGEYECDNFFNFSVAAVPERDSPFSGDPRHAALAGWLLRRSGVDRGVCLLLGSVEGRLALEIVKRSRLRVVGVDTDAEAVASARRALATAGVYGTRASVHRVDRYDDLPFTSCFANLIVAERLLEGGDSPRRAAEMYRVLRPSGGVAFLGQPASESRQPSPKELDAWSDSPDVEVVEVVEGEGKRWAIVKRPALAGAGEWSHLYGSADNSSYGGETLENARAAGDLDVQWIGRPGPRAQPDRNGRKPSPLAINGRLFTQGLHRIIAIDAFNGSILWSLETPTIQRFNMPRDCGNWCADDDHLYVAVREKCWRLDARSGDLSKLYDVLPGRRSDWGHDWGYLSSQGKNLIGSAVKAGTSFTSFWGGSDAGWYDARSGEATRKVCGENLFALDKVSGDEVWKYENGLIIHPTIAVGGGRVYFVESRNEPSNASSTRRLGSPEFWEDQFLVALELESGKKLWEQPIDTVDGIVVFYLAYGKEKLSLVSSKEQYHVYTFSAYDGTPLWESALAWDGKDHGHHMARPAIVGSKLYVRPGVFDLDSGEKLAQAMPGGGCGTYAATDRAMFFRSGNVTMWDREDGSVSSWSRLRPDCWLSTIPACGMLLSPEGGGGCSCGSWMETSIGFIPRTRLARSGVTEKR